MENDKNEKIEYSEKSIKKIKMEFNNMLNDIELLNSYLYSLHDFIINLYNLYTTLKLFISLKYFISSSFL